MFLSVSSIRKQPTKRVTDLTQKKTMVRITPVYPEATDREEMKAEESEEAGVDPAAGGERGELRGRDYVEAVVVGVNVVAAQAGEVAVEHPDTEIFRHVRSNSLTFEFNDSMVVQELTALIILLRFSVLLLMCVSPTLSPSSSMIVGSFKN